MSSLAIGFLDWRGKATAKNSINSYLSRGLLTLADQSIYFGQEGGTVSESETLAFGFTDRVESSVNINIANAFVQMLEICEADLFLFLENDWELIEDATVTMKRLADGDYLLNSQQGITCVRYRHRAKPGEPLYTRQFAGREFDSPKHLIDCMHWDVDPRSRYPIYFNETGISSYLKVRAEFANWTNNPCMFKTEWLREYIVPKLTSGSNLEDDLNNWWPKQDWYVAMGYGLFTHKRLD